MINNFILYLQVCNNWVPISSDTKEGHDVIFSTYDENLVENEHSQFSLSFSFVGKLYNENIIKWHPLLRYFYIGAKLRLDWNNEEIPFIIKSVSPEDSSKNVVYKIEAQDEVSYLWSRHNIGYSYKTLAEDKETLTIKNIYNIARDVLNDNYLSKEQGGEWKIAAFPDDKNDLAGALVSYDTLNVTNFSVDIINSNPYNVLIEACNTANAYMKIYFKYRTIDFFRKADIKNSGYRYHPNRNLIDYDVSYSGEEMCTLLHVSGGEDENGNVVTMNPPIPSTIEKYLDEQTRNSTQEEAEKFWKEFNWSDLNRDSIISSYGTIPFGQLKPSTIKIFSEDSSEDTQNIDFLFDEDQNRWYYTTYTKENDNNVKEYSNFRVYVNEQQEGYFENSYGLKSKNPKNRVNVDNRTQWFGGLPNKNYYYDIDDYGNYILCMPNIVTEEYFYFGNFKSANATYNQRELLQFSFQKGDQFTVGIFYESKTDGTETYRYLYVTSDYIKITSEKDGSGKEICEYNLNKNAEKINFKIVSGTKDLEPMFKINNEPWQLIEDEVTIKNFRCNFVPQKTAEGKYIINAHITNVSLGVVECNNISLQELYPLLENYKYNEFTDSYSNSSEIKVGDETKNEEPGITYLLFPPYLDEEDKLCHGIYIKLLQENYNEFKENTSTDYENEYDKFMQTATANPSLSQFILNLDYFIKTAQLSKEEYNNMLKNFAIYNVPNVYYTLKKSRNLTSLVDIEKLFKIKSETFLSEYNALFSLDRKIEESEEKILYNSYLILRADFINEITNLMALWLNAIKNIGKNDSIGITSYSSRINSMIDNVKKQIELNGQLILEAQLKKDYTTAETIKSSNDILKQYIQDDLYIGMAINEGEGWVEQYDMGPYLRILDICKRLLDGNEALTNELDTTTVVYIDNTEELKEWTKDLYQKYGQYIYEQEYSNTEEFDSISLYNQALAYFADLNRVHSSHSAEVLDIGSLEHIFTPRLSIGSYISVYNPNTIEMIPYADLLGEIETQQELYNFYLETNQINKIENTKNKIISLKRQLISRYDPDYEIIVAPGDLTNDELQKYGEIEEKLYQDILRITSITRTLRDPLRDRLSVEQSSRYKSILGKLIKSI